MPPLGPTGSGNHMQQQITRYMRKAGTASGVKNAQDFVSLRHSAGSMLLEWKRRFRLLQTCVGILIQI